MELKLFRTLWSVTDPLPQVAAEAAAAAFDGLELPAPGDGAELDAMLRTLGDYGLQWIAEICTAGSYVPYRDADLATHIADLEAGLARVAGLGPVKVNCLGGLDAWPLETSLRFFEAGLAAAERHGLELCFETHRGRSLFNPWVTAGLVERLPQLRLNADVSHWCVVAERLMDSEMDTIEAIAPNVVHIHGRVGYSQGPQVPDPAAPEYAEALASHQRCWEVFWRAQHAAGRAPTLTPEFGADGYLHTLPYTQIPVADLWQLNQWIARTERAHYRRWYQTELAASA